AAPRSPAPRSCPRRPANGPKPGRWPPCSATCTRAGSRSTGPRTSRPPARGARPCPPTRSRAVRTGSTRRPPGAHRRPTHRPPPGALLPSAPVPGADGVRGRPGRLSRAAQPWLAQHTVGGRTLVPGTVFAELALLGGGLTGAVRLRELTMEAPLALPAEGDVR